MKPISAYVIKSLQAGSFIKCVDNSGANLIQVIAVKGYKGVKNRSPRCGVGDWIIAAVKDGNPKIMHEVVQAIIVRQRKEYRRRSGLRVKFEDNAAVLINEKGEPRGTKIKGPIAKEVVERFSMIGKIATTVL
ncbi:50S ribosomal protein L14 [Candidatus Micrarchaeota archaeon RBG_16_36_9]|nr:50S ribosomal protein L14P, large subunit ribosomal protein L14 [uncultured archaeon]OGI11937.1 MAG: 50S ribosomal protein L14 [Candidatus Micrarchaeota archaeon RBG_16_36_9]